MSVQFPSLIAMPMPILTPRLLIRPVQPGDGPSLYAAINASRDHLQRFLPWVDDSHHTQEDSENYARMSQSKFLTRTEINLIIVDRSTGTLYGGTGFPRMNWNLPAFEIGYWLHQNFVGLGLMTEAVNALTRYAFDQLQAKRVEIRFETDNQRSRAVAERLGYEADGCLRHDRYKHQSQELTDTWIFSRLNAAGLPKLSVSW